MKKISLKEARETMLNFMKKMDDERNKVMEEDFEEDTDDKTNIKPIGNFDEYRGCSRGSLPGDDYR